MTQTSTSCTTIYSKIITKYYGCVANIYRAFFNSEVFEPASKSYCLHHKLGDCKTNTEIFMCHYATSGGAKYMKDSLELQELDNKTFGIFLRSIFPDQTQCTKIISPFSDKLQGPEKRCIELIEMGTKYSLQARALNELCEDINIEDKVFGVLFDTNLESL
ncbi:MAG: hypothetical protein RLN62_04085 [Rickettsiales bacterium]